MTKKIEAHAQDYPPPLAFSYTREEAVEGGELTQVAVLQAKGLPDMHVDMSFHAVDKLLPDTVSRVEALEPILRALQARLRELVSVDPDQDPSTILLRDPKGTAHTMWIFRTVQKSGPNVLICDPDDY